MSRHRDTESRIYVGNLPRDIRERELEDVFYKYGRITDIAIKNMGDPAFAFISFEDPRDASDAIHGRNGYEFDGRYRLRVERSNSGRRDRDRGGDRDRDRGGDRFERRDKGRFTGRRSEWRITVDGLPKTGSWQDLKDFCREAGDVLYSDVTGDGTGVVEFARQDDMEWALKNLDGKKFRSHLDESATVTVRPEKESGGSGSRRDDSPRRSRSRSRSRSPRGRSASRSRSPRSRSRSPPRSPDDAAKSPRDASPRSRSGSPRD